MRRDEFVTEACNTDASLPPPSCKLIGTDWTEWSPCTASCGSGTSHRTREAVIGVFFNCTKVDEIEATVCEAGPKGTEWTEWTPGSVICGDGTKTRTRYVVTGTDTTCIKNEVVKEDHCNLQACTTSTTTSAPTTTTLDPCPLRTVQKTPKWIQSIAITGQSGARARLLAVLEAVRGSDKLLMGPSQVAPKRAKLLKLLSVENFATQQLRNWILRKKP